MNQIDMCQINEAINASKEELRTNIKNMENRLTSKIKEIKEEVKKLNK